MKNKRKSKSYTYANTAREATSCPSCSLSYKETDHPECPRCGVSYPKTTHIFPYPAPPLSPVMDHTNTIQSKTHTQIISAFSKITKKYPQLRIYFCNVNLVIETDPRIFGFWLFNSSPLNDTETSEQRQFSLLITIDQENKRLGSTAGYLLEPFLPTTELYRTLESFSRLWFSGQLEESILSFKENLIEILDSSKKNLLKKKRF